MQNEVQLRQWRVWKGTGEEAGRYRQARRRRVKVGIWERHMKFVAMCSMPQNMAPGNGEVWELNMAE